MLLANIKLVMGESGKTTFSILLGFLAALLLFCVILLFVRNILKRFGKISASGALRFGAPQEQNGIAGKLRLCRRVCPEPIFLMDFTISFPGKRYMQPTLSY